ncbi:hypothetical protein [Modestobacter marinus]|uniref:hypothetical protein n=1 Tax=Modestobacter marinus TaxID=477641 RepID=UPI001C988585|nr:hypothetical protein [Modestobacter marinus]
MAEVLPGSHGYDLEEVIGLEPAVWATFPIDDLEPASVDAALLEHCATLVAGLLVIVTEQSYRASAGPFFTTAESLEDFVTQYTDHYDDVFVGADLVIVCPSRGTVVAVHHNGLIATLIGNSLPL